MRASFRNGQRGLSLVGFLMVMGLAIFFALIGMKMGPYYLRNHSINTVLQGMKDEPGVTKMAPNQIKDLIMRRLDINSVYNFDRKDINVAKDRGFFIMTAEYEVREHIVGNVDVILGFKNKAEIPIQ